MKKTLRIFAALFLLLIMTAGLSMAAFAEDYDKSDEGWEVVYEGKDKLTPNFTAGDITDLFNEMQPGDSMKIKITLKNASENDTNFWMKNAVLAAFEESNASAAGAAYTYRLTYSGLEDALYDSENVGGDDTTAGEGLHEATSGLEENYVFLETLAPGKTGYVELYIELDGETQGNDYKNSSAEIELEFAVEEMIEEEVVVTGDAMNATPWTAIAGVSGMILLVLAVIRFRVFARERRA